MSERKTAYNCFGQFDKCAGSGLGCPDAIACKQETRENLEHQFMADEQARIDEERAAEGI